MNLDRKAVLNAELEATLNDIKSNLKLSVRHEVFQRVKNVVSSFIPNCQAELYGSSLNGTCLPSSDVNVVISCSGMRPNKLLRKCSNLNWEKKTKFPKLSPSSEVRFFTRGYR